MSKKPDVIVHYLMRRRVLCGFDADASSNGPPVHTWQNVPALQDQNPNVNCEGCRAALDLLVPR